MCTDIKNGTKTKIKTVTRTKKFDFLKTKINSLNATCFFKKVDIYTK